MNKPKKALLPERRFPEFKDAEQWEISSIGKKTTKVGSGITPRGGSKNYLTKGRPFVRSQNVGWGKLLLDEVVYINEETHSTFEASEIKLNDVLLNITGASIGRSAVADQRINGGNVNQHVCIVRAKADELIPLFLNQFLISNDGQNQIDSFQAGGNREGLNFAQIRSFNLPLPSPSEQQKIADCLSSLDDLISARAQKLEALTAHKKGLMQQLFPAQGQTTPQRRFPEFRDTGPWQEKRLGDDDVSIFVSDRMPREELRIESYVSTVNLMPDFAGVTLATKLPPSGGATRFVKNDILMSNIRPYLKKICLSLKDGAASNDVIVARAKESVSSQFLSFLLMNDLFVDYVMVGAKGVKMPRGDMAQMKEYTVTIPTPPEQQKISTCLISVDDLIRAESQKLDALKAHKKGLMQQLFPINDKGS